MIVISICEIYLNYEIIEDDLPDLDKESASMKYLLILFEKQKVSVKTDR